MRLMLSVAAVTALAISGSGCKGMSGHGGGGLTAAECKAVLVKGYQLQETPEALYKDVVDQAAKSCETKDALSRKDYDCAIKASTLQEYVDCKIVLDLT